MRRAQFDRPIMFILAIVVVGLVLYVGYLGIAYMISIQESREVTTFWNTLDRSVNRNMNIGALETITISLPKAQSICFFNVSLDPLDKECEIYNDNNIANGKNITAMLNAGNKTCEEFKSYWGLTSETAESDNIILSSGLTHRNPRIMPSNEKYQCFEGNVIQLRLEGKGRHVLIS